MIALFDIETNGLYFDATVVHSLVIKDARTGNKYSCCDHAPYKYGIKDGLKLLMEADLLVGHNIINFDLPTLQKIYPEFKYDINKVRDTLILSRLVYSDLSDRDYGVIRKGKLPAKLRGSHGLKAWGYRLGILKGEFAEETDWQHWSKSMQDYCEQDVDVTEALWSKLQTKHIAERSVTLEHWFSYVISKQEKFGYKFDVSSAEKLYQQLAIRRVEIDEQLLRVIPAWYVSAGTVTPKVNNRTRGVTKGVPYTKVKLQVFNPSSRQQIADRLIKLYGWKPKEFTPSGQPQVDETTLSVLKMPEAKLLAERFMVEKRLGQLAEGQQAWLKLERNGRIHGSVNTIGAVTGRCTHSAPNVAQVPSTRAPYGTECRSLFTVDDGYVQIGADASGLELRCLAHYMAKYDGGSYARELLEGDIHTANQIAAGLPTRDNAKTFIYGFLYGAGDAKIGEIVGKGAKEGRRLKTNFLNKTPALKRLREDVTAVIKKRGYLVGIDGRHLHIRHAHAALNTLLQSAGALLVKQATVNLYQMLSTKGYEWGKDWAMVAHVHDEYQLQVRKEIAEDVAQVAEEAFRQAGRDFNWRCPLDGEAKIGNNWADCH